MKNTKKPYSSLKEAYADMRTDIVEILDDAKNLAKLLDKDYFERMKNNDYAGAREVVDKMDVTISLIGNKVSDAMLSIGTAMLLQPTVEDYAGEDDAYSEHLF